MRIAFVVFDGMTTLDFLGVFDPLTRLKTMGLVEDVAWDVCGMAERVRDGAGLVIATDRVCPPLGGYDLVVVPGGLATRALEEDAAFVDWLRGAEGAGRVASVCTGSLLLGAAGLLRGRRATTHPSAFDELRRYDAVVSGERIVDEGWLVTARGVTSSIDLGLYLVGQMAGDEVRERIRRQMDYEAGSGSMTAA